MSKATTMPSRPDSTVRIAIRNRACQIVRIATSAGKNSQWLVDKVGLNSVCDTIGIRKGFSTSGRLVTTIEHKTTKSPKSLLILIPGDFWGYNLYLIILKKHGRRAQNQNQITDFQKV